MSGFRQNKLKWLRIQKRIFTGVSRGIRNFKAKSFFPWNEDFCERNAKISRAIGLISVSVFRQSKFKWLKIPKRIYWSFKRNTKFQSKMFFPAVNEDFCKINAKILRAIGFSSVSGFRQNKFNCLRIPKRSLT